MSGSAAQGVVTHGAMVEEGAMWALPVSASVGLTVAFVAVCLVVWGAWVALAYRAAAGSEAGASASSGAGVRVKAALVAGVGLLAWAGVVCGLAAGGFLHVESVPPRLVMLVVPAAVVATVLGLSRVAGALLARVPLWVLVLVQGFRLPLELVMHEAALTGLMPPQMTLGEVAVETVMVAGRNYDIATGVMAVVAAGLLAKGWLPLVLFRAFNVVGFVLLANVVTVAVASFPGPTRVLVNLPMNVWVTYVPFVLLPTFLVPSALFGHVMFFRVTEEHLARESPLV